VLCWHVSAECCADILNWPTYVFHLQTITSQSEKKALQIMTAWSRISSVHPLIQKAIPNWLFNFIYQITELYKFVLQKYASHLKSATFRRTIQICIESIRNSRTNIMTVVRFFWFSHSQNGPISKMVQENTFPKVILLWQLHFLAWTRTVYVNSPSIPFANPTDWNLFAE
jgi:hypothetical protein